MKQLYRNGEPLTTTPNVARMIKYDNGKSGLVGTNAQAAIDEVKSSIDEVGNVADEALSVAKGRNRARVFNTTDDMNAWLSDETNAGVAIVGDNLYIVDLGVPDWWISEVLTEVDPDTGFYYKIAQLETQKVDLTTIEAEIDEIQSDLKWKKIGTTTNKVPLEIPSGYNELLIFVEEPNNWQVELNIPTMHLTENIQYFQCGSSMMVATLYITTTSVTPNTVYYNDQQVTDFTTTVYAR